MASGLCRLDHSRVRNEAGFLNQPTGFDSLAGGMRMLDKILDTKYDVYLKEADYVWNEYDDWTSNRPVLLKTFKDQQEANEYLALCEKHKAEVQKKYRGKISYYIQPMYLRTFQYNQWSPSKSTQEEQDALLARFLPKEERPYTG